MMPISPKAMLTAVPAESKALLVTLSILPVKAATMMAIATNANQTWFIMGMLFSLVIAKLVVDKRSELTILLAVDQMMRA